LAELLAPGSTLALIGTLGAGKTRLVQALAAGLGVDRRRVVSPTFVLCQQYSADPPLIHLDTYRLNDEEEFLDLGVEEFFEGEGITVIEWADRVQRCLPADHLRIEIEVTGHTSRRITLTAVGRSDPAWLAALAARLQTASS
jgi:tRNA threonylcarbamoyladenosine biosynthesis protein TsaE